MRVYESLVYFMMKIFNFNLISCDVFFFVYSNFNSGYFAFFKEFFSY